MLFEQKDKELKFRALLQVDSTERDRFIYIPNNVFEQEKAQGLVFYIALSANMIDDERMAISYSLPKFVDMNNSGGSDIGIFNSSVVLVRNVKTLKPDSLVAFDFDLEHSPYFHQHFTFDWFDNKIFMGCEKLTWPMDGYEQDEISNKVELNPFDDRFYDTFNPLIASFDSKNGKQLGHYGRLEDSQRKSKTGYFFMNPVYTHYGREFLYGNGYTGCLYLCDSTDIANPYKSYHVFDIDTSKFPIADTTKYYTFDYGMQFDHSFSRCIIAIQMDKSNIYCLVKHGRPRSFFSKDDDYVYSVINKKTGMHTDYLLPHIEVCTPLEYGIRKNKGRYNPFEFVKSDRGYFVKVLSL